MRFLVVDDFELGREVIKQAVLAKGFPPETVVVAENGTTALKYINESATNGPIFNLIFLDIILPDIDGLDILREIRKNKALDASKVIVVTGENEEVTSKQVKELGGNVFLPKPISRKQIFLILESFYPNGPTK